jgi:hypothetical protein
MVNEKGNVQSWKEAVAKCKNILEQFKPEHKRVKVFVGFEVEPAEWLDCNHAESPEQALRIAKQEDVMQKMLR